MRKTYSGDVEGEVSFAFHDDVSAVVYSSTKPFEESLSFHRVAVTCEKPVRHCNPQIDSCMQIFFFEIT